MNRDDYYLGIAEAVSAASPCLKRKYGAVIVQNDEIIATGYNGPPRGWPHCKKCQKLDLNRDLAEYETCRSVHAEMNAIISASRKEMQDATLYLAGTHEHPEPCGICKRLIANAGIRKVVTKDWEQWYRYGREPHTVKRGGIL